MNEVIHLTTKEKIFEFPDGSVTINSDKILTVEKAVCLVQRVNFKLMEILEREL